MFSKTYGEDDVLTNTALDLSVFGHLVRNNEMASVVLRRYGTVSILQKLKYLLETLKIVWIASDKLRKAIEMNEKIDVNVQETDNAAVLHKKIQHYLNNVFAELVIYHTIVSRASVIYQFVVMSILAREANFTPEHYHDISLLFSCHADVVSAEIPKQLQLLAQAISEANLSEEFLATEEPIAFLKQRSPIIYEKFVKFLMEQGHRALREFELHETSWGANPEKMMAFVKHNVKTGNFGGNSKSLSVDETVAKLLTPKSAITRFLLSVIVKKSRSAVARREATKCELSRSVNKLRKAYALLANKLKEEGKIPNINLIYHLSDHEIGQIIAANNPILVKKALLRRRLYSRWNGLKFPEICRGIPHPDKNDVMVVTGKTIEIRGTPVCMGEVEARACVITDVRDADQLQQGDILITYSTDTAWSLYFPMISGIVTELGGLISHGNSILSYLLRHFITFYI